MNFLFPLLQTSQEPAAEVTKEIALMLISHI